VLAGAAVATDDIGQLILLGHHKLVEVTPVLTSWVEGVG
jgi:hypothetical protein